jgi:hypothetical protein
MKGRLFSLFYSLFLVFIISCSPYEDISIKGEDRSLAVPIAYGNLTLQDLIDRSTNKASIRVDQDGKLTAYYEGEVLRENSSKIFPPVPGIFEFPIPAPVSEVVLPIKSTYKVDKGTFDNTSIFFNVSHNVKEVVKLKMTIPSVSKDGKIWSQEYNLDFTNSNTGIILTPTFNLDKWIALLKDNKIRFEYTATKSNGTVVNLQSIAMKYDVLRFSYLDGYFGNHIFDIKGNTIKLNFYDGWKRGGIVFENPNILLSVDNGFGFPVRSKINSFLAKTIDGKEFQFQSEFINKGIDFNYPTINEIGKLKTTSFRFTSANSNIGNVFQNKVSEIIYDFDAVANPDGEIGVKNFFNNESYFSVNVAVELPMNVRLEDLTVSDTFEINLDDIRDIKALDLVFDIDNNFPIQFGMNAIFLDNNNKEVYKIENANSLLIEAAVPGQNGKTSGPKNTLKNITIAQQDFAKVLSSRRVILSGSFDSKVSSQNPLWLYSNYGINAKIGAKVKIN